MEKIIDSDGFAHIRHLTATATHKLAQWVTDDIDFAYFKVGDELGKDQNARVLVSKGYCFDCHSNVGSEMLKAVERTLSTTLPRTRSEAQLVAGSSFLRHVRTRFGRNTERCTSCDKLLVRPSTNPDVLRAQLTTYEDALTTRPLTAEEALNAIFFLTWFPDATTFRSDCGDGMGDDQIEMAMSLCYAVLSSDF